MRNFFNFFPFLFLTASVIFFSQQISADLTHSYPAITQLILDSGEDFKQRGSYEQPFGASGGFRDISLLLLGTRRLGADVAWISILQYYGGEESEGKEEFVDRPLEGRSEKYPSLKKLTLRTLRLDPQLHYAVLYGAGALAFNLNRPEEAVEILEEAIQRNPQYWKYQLYLGAILYKQKGKFDSMLHLLEDAIQYPDCPTLIKSILANIYKVNKNYVRSLQIWIEIYEGKDTSYHEKARNQIEELKQKLGLQT